MARFLIDVNLPSRFSIWRGEEYEYVVDLDRRLPDGAIWEYARERDMVIVSKDADFADRIILSVPPPRFMQVCIGNSRLRDLHTSLADQWPIVLKMIDDHKLIRIFQDRIEALADD